MVTPHLGASTDEAQEKAGVSVAKSVRLALAGELVPDAVNVAGGVIAPDVRPGIPLMEKLGRIFTALTHASLTQFDVEVAGEISSLDVKVLELAALKGIFADVVTEQVSYVNAPVIAEQRGINVRLITTPDTESYRNVLTLRGALSDGSADLRRRNPDRAQADPEARRRQRLRGGDPDQRTPRGGRLLGPPRRDRHDRPHPGHEQHQHRRHAGGTPGRRAARCWPC